MSVFAGDRSAEARRLNVSDEGRPCVVKELELQGHQPSPSSSGRHTLSGTFFSSTLLPKLIQLANLVIC